MKINNTSIKSFDLTNNEKGDIILKKAGEIPNKKVRGKFKLIFKRMRELLKGITDIDEGSKILCENGFAVSRSEGRRLFAQIKAGGERRPVNDDER